MATTRYAYAGAPLESTLTGTITNVDTAGTLSTATGWPSGAPFPVVMDPGEANEEHAICTRSGTSLTFTTRGANGTTAAGHSGGAVIYPIPTASIEMNSFNRLASTPTTKGDLIGTDSSGDPVRRAVGTDHQALIADSGQASGLAYANAPKGVMGYAEVTANQAGITTIVDLTSLTVTFTAISSRRYRTRVVGSPLSSVGGDFGRIDITDSAGSTTVEASQHLLSTTAYRQFAEVIETGLSGSITRKARYSRTAGTGSLTMTASSATKAFIIVEDIGPA
jgi:hypothetical protein